MFKNNMKMRVSDNNSFTNLLAMPSSSFDCDAALFLISPF